MSLFHELKRRNVFRVAAAYVVVAWLAIQIVETIFPAFGFTDAAIRVTTIVFGIGLIPTMIFAWAFELTPEGLKKDSEVARSGSITPHTGKKLDRMIMVVLAVALGYFAFDKFVLDPQREEEQLTSLEEQKTTEVAQARQQGRTEALVESFGEKSIAVLPFVNMSSDVEQEYFSDGISEELLNLLAKIPELRVISRTSAFSYKGKDIKLAQVAEELNVAHILEGSVRKAGNKVRITAQLIEARSDTHLWSETYDRQLDDIFAIQDEIAAEVVAQLKVTLLVSAPMVDETDPEAYTLYLQARQLGNRNTYDAAQQSDMLYKQALAIDPNYASAWSGLAQNYLNQAAFGYGLLSVDEGQRLAREAANHALALNPKHAPAYIHLGRIEYTHNRDLEAAARLLERALELEPANPDTLREVTWLSMDLDRPDESIAVGEYVVDRDPANPESHYNLGFAYLWARRLDEAILSFRAALMLSPGYNSAHYRISVALLLKGEPQAALAEIQQEQGVTKRLEGETIVYHALGQPVESNVALAELIDSDRAAHASAYNIAYVLAFRGEADRAFMWLDKAVQYNDVGLAQTANQPEFANIHDDARWLPFLESIGLSPLQLAAIEFKVTLPD